MNVSESVKSNLCVSCGVCGAICPVDCITFKREGGVYHPVLGDKCVDCGKCLSVCPAEKFELKGDEADFERALLGSFSGVYSVRAKDEKLLKNSQSGGFVTQTVKALLDAKKYDVAFLIDGYNYDGYVAARPFFPGDDLTNTAKSRYLPVSHGEGAKYIAKNPAARAIFVATPCAAKALANFIAEKKLDRQNYLIIGLFCDKTMNYNIVDYFEAHARVGGKIDKLYFRTKDAGGWPGNVRIVKSDGAVVDLSKKERTSVKEYFQLERCLYCDDKMNRSADISVGDNYEGSSDERGSGSIIVRTAAGKDAFDLCRDMFEVKESSGEAMKKSQKLSSKKQNLIFAQAKRTGGDEKYAALMKKISLGGSGAYREIYKATRPKKLAVLKKKIRKLFKK